MSDQLDYKTWPYLIPARVDSNGRLILRAVEVGGYWVQSPGGADISIDRLDTATGFDNSEMVARELLQESRRKWADERAALSRRIEELEAVLARRHQESAPRVIVGRYRHDTGGVSQ